jgi:Ala-tRNA(Pro) deacylase
MSTEVQELLTVEKVPYHEDAHRTAYTAQQVAAEEHIPGKMIAKSVVIKVDERFALAVLSASRRAELSRLKAALGAKGIRLPSELEFIGLFPDCEVGAMPPFGNLYGLPVYVDKTLAEDDEMYSTPERTRIRSG